MRMQRLLSDPSCRCTVIDQSPHTACAMLYHSAGKSVVIHPESSQSSFLCHDAYVANIITKQEKKKKIFAGEGLHRQPS
jgi:hypothetical protein